MAECQYMYQGIVPVESAGTQVPETARIGSRSGVGTLPPPARGHCKLFPISSLEISRFVITRPVGNLQPRVFHDADHRAWSRSTVQSLTHRIDTSERITVVHLVRLWLPRARRPKGKQPDPRLRLHPPDACPAPGDWKGIYFRNPTQDSESLLGHCIVEYAGHTHNANIYLASASPTIKNCDIQHSSANGISLNASSPVIDGNELLKAMRVAESIVTGVPMPR